MLILLFFKWRQKVGHSLYIRISIPSQMLIIQSTSSLHSTVLYANTSTLTTYFNTSTPTSNPPPTLLRLYQIHHITMKFTTAASVASFLAASASAMPTDKSTGYESVDFTKIDYPKGTGENLDFYPAPPGGMYSLKPHS